MGQGWALNAILASNIGKKASQTFARCGVRKNCGVKGRRFFVRKIFGEKFSFRGVKKLGADGGELGRGLHDNGVNG